MHIHNATVQADSVLVVWQDHRKLTTGAILDKLDSLCTDIVNSWEWAMLTAFGRLVVSVSVVLLLLSCLIYFFIVTHRGQDLLCQRGQVCFAVTR